MIVDIIKRMRLLIQIVKNAEVNIENRRKENIGCGMLVFVGFKSSDTKEIVDKMVSKLFKLRVFSDGEKTNLSLNDVKGDILCVSQFTLYADSSEGNRPSFTKCMKADEARSMYNYFVDKILENKSNAKFGEFQTDMEVNLLNNGPFTILLDSGELKYE